MAHTFKTLLKTDPEYKDYLLGTFSKRELALPQESFGVGSDRERTTFLIVQADHYPKPHWSVIYFRAIRPELLGLTLGHAFLALLALWFRFPQHEFLDFVSMGLCLAATLFAHASACLFNDFQDHLNGTDRRSITHGSRVIQKGWSAAYKVRRWAIVNALLAFGIGIYLMFGSWNLLIGLTALSAMAILFYSEMTPFWNKWGAGDFWITILFGPLLFFSVWASVLPRDQFFTLPNEFFVEGIFLSLCLGFLASWTLQVRQFQDIFKREQGSFRTLISRLNFDQAKSFLIFEGGVFFLLQAVGGFFVSRHLILSGFLLLGAIVSMGMAFRMRAVTSPLSSKMLHLTRRALMIHGGFIFLWAVVLCLR